MCCRFFIVFLSIVLSLLINELAIADQPRENLEQSQLFVGLELAKQKIDAKKVVTAFGNVMTPYNREDLAARISVGYLLRSYIAFESGFTSVSGYGYQVSPNNDSIHYGFYSLDMMLKLRASSRRIGFFVAGGGALIYTNLENFFAINPKVSSIDIYGRYRPAYWPDHLFFRPRVSTGITFKVNQRFSFAIIYAYIFGAGKFRSRIGTVDSTMSLLINPHFIPSFSTLGAAIILRV